MTPQDFQLDNKNESGKIGLGSERVNRNQVQEEGTEKSLQNDQCCDKLTQIKNDVFVNAEVRYTC